MMILELTSQGAGLVSTGTDQAAFWGAMAAVVGTLGTVIGYVVKMNIKLNNAMMEQNRQLSDVIVQNTVAFKDLQSEIKILSESQRTFLPLLLKEMAR